MAHPNPATFFHVNPLLSKISFVASKATRSVVPRLPTRPLGTVQFAADCRLGCFDHPGSACRGGRGRLSAGKRPLARKWGFREPQSCKFDAPLERYAPVNAPTFCRAMPPE